MVKKIMLITLVIHVVFGALSAWRAWVQVRSLDLQLTGPLLRGGTTARVDVVSSGRVPVDVSLEMIQGTHAETVGVARVPANGESFWDPRSRPASMAVVFTPEVLSHFAAGPLLVRATARGRPQWLREPPPLVRELQVTK
jgi:hypothetical protein